MPFLMSFALEPEIVTLAWIDNISVQFPLNIYPTKGRARSKMPFHFLLCPRTRHIARLDSRVFVPNL